MGKHGQQDGFGHSMTDLMAGVAVTFLLIAAIFMVQVGRNNAQARAEIAAAQARIDKKETTNTSRAKDKLFDLKKKLEDNEEWSKFVNVLHDNQTDPLLLTIVLDRKWFRFEEGKCDLESARWSENARSSFLGVFGEICKAADSQFVQSIMLEGHTDNSPFFPRTRICGVEPSQRECHEDAASKEPLSPQCEALSFENNVRLSAARAQSAFFEMQHLITDTTIKKCLEKKFVVAGRGPVDPLDGGDWNEERTEEARQANRRVVVKVRASAPSTDAPLGKP